MLHRGLAYFTVAAQHVSLLLLGSQRLTEEQANKLRDNLQEL